MDNENSKRRRAKKPRQKWNPHWILKLLYVVWTLALSAIKVAIGAVVTVLLIVIVCAVVFIGTLGDYLQSDILPEAADFSLEDYAAEGTSFIYYVKDDGNIEKLQQIHTTTDRQWVSLEDMPQDLINATIAIEDKRFYEHQGVDWITTVKACLNMFMGGDSQFGGSTVTQQLVKNVTGDKSVTVQRKVMEIFRAQLCEQKYDKDTIMEHYLNRIYLGEGSYGVKSAAAAYFGKELQSLTVAECAALIGITNNPSLYNPYSQSEYEFRDHGMTTGVDRNRIRQLNILEQMHEQGMITDEEYEEAQTQELVFKDGIDLPDRWAECEKLGCGYEGTVSTLTQEGQYYYCPDCGNQIAVSEDASQYVYSWFVDAVIQDFAAELAALDGVDYESADKDTKEYYLLKIQTGGYHIYTTLDMEVQEAVDAIYTDLSKIPTTNSRNQLQSGIVIIDDRTGDIVALSGGVGEKETFFAYNRATQAKLQTGSSQKPLSVYAPAFESGAVTPATVIKDMPATYIGSGGYPKNDDRRYQYARTVLSGVQSSVNAVAANTLLRIGYEYSYSFAKYNFGQASLTDNYPLANGESKSDLGIASLSLGALTIGSTVREMAAAYATFTNDGVYREARTFTKVYDSSGNLVLDNTQDSQKILSAKTVDYMNYCLYYAANYGTGGAATFNGQNVAGKTGTTSSNKDRWFCGFTGHYTAAVWCGFDQPEVISLRGSQANPAARLWKMVMQPIHAGLDEKSLYNGNNLRHVSVCLDSGLMATAACRNDVRETSRVASAVVYEGDYPGGYCNKHVEVEYCVTGGGVATEYCKLFAEQAGTQIGETTMGDVKIEERSLVLMSDGEISELSRADGYGLNDIYTDDGYVYLASGDAWHGFNGNANKGSDEPYLVCPVHTKDAHEELEEQIRLEEEKKKQEEEEKKRQEEEEKKKQEEAAAQATAPTETTAP